MNNAYEKFGMWLATVAIILLATLLIGFPIKWAWNGVMPGVFDLPEITYWNAVWMYFLFHMLFRGVTINDE